MNWAGMLRKWAIRTKLKRRLKKSRLSLQNCKIFTFLQLFQMELRLHFFAPPIFTDAPE
jgi:hypothetical protein